MRKLTTLLLALCLVACGAVEAQETYKIYLPLVACDRGDCYMGIWSIVVPEATDNETLNPSGEIAANFAAIGGGTMTRVTTYQWAGVYGYRIQTAANNEGGTLTLQALDNAIHYVTVRVFGTLPAAWDWSLDNANYTAPALIKAYDADWSLYGLQFPAAQANASTTLYIRQNGAGAGDFYIDGIQVEQKTGYWTTYCDGTQEGCEWNGAEHASTSTRSALSRAGGRVRPLTDYYFEIAREDGIGMPPQELGLQEYAILPGGEMTSVREGSLAFTLTGAITDTVGIGFDGLEDVHAAREALINLLRPNTYPYVDGDPQPVRFRYTGAATEKELAAHYEAGLELRINGRFPCWERVAFRFIADDPFWKEIGNQAVVLDTEDAATLRYVAGRLRTTGQWDDLNVTINPGNFGGATRIFAQVIGPDGKLYIGGNFTNWEGVAGRSGVARYDLQTGTWETVGNVGDFTAIVYALYFGPDDTLYAGGAFLNCAGDANADYLAQYDISTDTWSAVAAGGTGNVFTIVMDPTGELYFGGSFNNWNGNASSDNIAKWTGVAYTNAQTGGCNGAVTDLAVSPEGYVYAVGAFQQMGGNNRFYASYTPDSGANWNIVADNSINASLEGIEFDEAGREYVGGNFTNASSNANADRVASTLGQIWEAMGTGANGAVYHIELAPDSSLYASGNFTSIGGITTADRIARWKRTAWAQLDVNLPGAPIVDVILAENQDPVVTSNYDLFIGFTTTGAATLAGTVTVTNAGTAEAYPIFTITRSGGTSANLSSIRNETLGLELLFDYDLLDGETLTIDLAPENKSIVSSFAGSVPGAALPNSDFGTWRLNPGTNQVTSFVDVAGAPTITATMEWTTQWAGCDD